MLNNIQSPFKRRIFVSIGPCHGWVVEDGYGRDEDDGEKDGQGLEDEQARGQHQLGAARHEPGPRIWSK